MDKKEYKKNIFIDSSFQFSPNNSSFTGDNILQEHRTSSIEQNQYEIKPYEITKEKTNIK